ncbi:MAG: DUF4184 family protein [Pseudomonadota bacterium]
MPFTPLHMGPGLFMKAVAGRHFSVLAFGIAQVAMDIEPLIGMMRGSAVLHGATHTYVAAILMALLVAILAPPICRPVLRRWNRELSYHKLDWLIAPESLAPVPVVIGAFIGTLSHVALDSLMHADIRPLAPWSSSNVLLQMSPGVSLDVLCVAAGAVGVVGWLAAGLLRRRAGRADGKN